jgi:hypothetical protein
LLNHATNHTQQRYPTFEKTLREPRIYVDFNEMIEENLVLLSKTDFKQNSDGVPIELKEGMSIKIYSDDENDLNERDNLIADGIVELNTYGEWTKPAKWNCRIDKNGIKHESDI